MIAIVGASGYIGKYLFYSFTADNYRTVGTYCHTQQPGFLHFDLRNPDFRFLDDLSISHLIIASAANARIDLTAERWEDSYETNSVGVKRLLNECFSRRIIPIYISSDGVFDGTVGNYREDNPRLPVNKYGEIRVDVENHLLTSSAPWIIVRAGRVFSSNSDDRSVLAEIKRALEQENEVRVAIDQWFTPIHIDDFYFFIRMLVDKNLYGIYHCASLPKINRFEIAREIKLYFELPGTILPRSLDSFNFPERRPHDTSLNIEKIKKITRFKERNIQYFLHQIK